jgi:spermidine synthase
VLGLVGAPDGLHLDLGELERRQGSPELQPHLRNVGLDRSLNLLGCLVAGPEQLQKFAGDASITTDDWPGVLFAAPRFSIRRQAPPPHELLLSLLRECRFNPESSTLRGATRDDAYLKSLADFISARDIYLGGLAKEEQGSLAEAMDLYLESARTSLHFLPAYARCVSIIQVLASTDRPQARRLYQRLEAAQPAQPLARKLFGSTLADETPAAK